MSTRSRKRAGARRDRRTAGDPALPLVTADAPTGVRTSRRGYWRAGVLIAVHVVAAAHIAHFTATGRSISPVEPSEAMYAIELGELNAGFVFFLAAIALTAVFGRFFCGWGCHLVALQDLCGWLMRRVGVRPRPLRSRWMLYVPAGLAIYMFVWPTLKRWMGVVPQVFPGFEAHFVTDAFWETFPGPVFTVLTFAVCGFAAVYFLGAKGFCSYGCPYGAFFAWADGLAPGRIRVTDACEQCGHCTVACTSNVVVHREVAEHGMVVDPGCMRCMDCADVCPKNALYYGFGRLPRPAWLERFAHGETWAGAVDALAIVGSVVFTFDGLETIPRVKLFWLGASILWIVGRARSSRGHDLREASLLIGTVASAWTFRGLYGGPPLLMSLGLGAITAFVAARLFDLVRRRDVRIQQQRLREDGRLRPAGVVFAVLAVLWLGFTCESALFRFHASRGAYWLERTEAPRADVLAGRAATIDYGDDHRRAVDGLRFHMGRADRLALVPTLGVKQGLAWASLLRDDVDAAVRSIGEALAISPDLPGMHQDLIEVLVARGRLAEAAEAMRAKDAAVGVTADDYFQLAVRFAMLEEFGAAADAFGRASELEPGNVDARFNRGGALRRAGRPAEAVDALGPLCEQGVSADACIELGLALRELGDLDEAIGAIERARALSPDSPEATIHLPRLIREWEAARDGVSLVD